MMHRSLLRKRKKPDMKKLEIISALVGLAGAVQNHGKTPQTDAVFAAALQLYSALPASDDAETASVVQEAVVLIHNEKNAAAPGCAVCASPCGGTSDYDLAKLAENTPAVYEKKLAAMELLGKVSEKNLDLCYKAVVWFSCVDEEPLLEELLAELRAAC